MKLPMVEAVEVHYWTVLLRDQFRPHGEEYPVRRGQEEKLGTNKKIAPTKTSEHRGWLGLFLFVL